MKDFVIENCEINETFYKMAAERIGLGRKGSKHNLKTLMLANQKLKRIANRTIFDGDMVDERYHFRKIVRLMTDIFQDGGRTDRFRKKDSEQNLKTLMLANQKLNRLAIRTIFDRDMVDERQRNRKILRLMTDIFQDGGRTDRFRKKRFKTKFEDHHVGYSETQTNCKSDYIRQRYGG